MKKLTKERAKYLKSLGYTQIASVVKSYLGSTYYHINSIDSILENGGKWIPAPRYYGSWNGPIGTSGKKIDWSITCKTYLI